MSSFFSNEKKISNHGSSFFLVLVESPSKCQKIQKILNEHYKDKKFIVKATVGHIRDLKKKELGIDVNNDFK